MEKWDEMKDKLVELEQENKRIKFENSRLEKHIIWYAESLAEAHLKQKEEVNNFVWLECQYDMLFELIQEQYGEQKAQELHREAAKRKNNYQSMSKTPA